MDGNLIAALYSFIVALFIFGISRSLFFFSLFFRSEFGDFPQEFKMDFLKTSSAFFVGSIVFFVVWWIS